MGVDQFWQSLTDLEGRARQERVRLNDNKLRLQHAWTATKHDPNAKRAAQHQAILRPLIHANSKSRVDYANMVAQFNKAVNAAAAVLREAGLSAPNLAGPELVVLVPVVAVAALGVAWAIYATVHEQNAEQTRLIDAASGIINNPASTPDQRAQAAATISKLAKQKPPGTDPLNLQALVPVALAIAAIVIVPPLLNLVPRQNPRRRRAVA